MKTFEEIYKNVPVARRNMLRQFRMTHPLQKMVIRGVEWEYLVSGQGPQALLILGGGGSRADSGFGTITRYEGSLRLLAPSYPPLASTGVLIDGLAELLAAEGIERVHVYGHSLGSGIAHILIRRYPQLVDKLALGSFGLYAPDNSRRIRAVIRLMQILPYRITSSSYQRRMQRSLDITDPQEQAFMQAYLEELFTVQLNKKSFVGQMSLIGDMIQNASEYHILEPVERPGKVLILQARDDRGFSPAEQQALVDTYPGARVITFESGGHLIQYTRREQYQQALDEFLIST
jgi:pimeloyl-ACP methyl ester carboxylesterase